MKPSRKLVGVMIAVVLVSGATAVVAKEGGVFSHYRVDMQSVRWTREQPTIGTKTWSYTDWGPKPGVAYLSMRGGLSVTVTGEAAGAPFKVRVMAEEQMLRPGPVTVRPGKGRGFSLTFARDFGNDPRCVDVFVQFRALTDRLPTLKKHATIATYRHEPPGPKSKCSSPGSGML